jgi:hypothetical protein
MAKKFVAAGDHTVISAFTVRHRKILQNKLGLRTSPQSSTQIKKTKKGQSEDLGTKSFPSKLEEDGLDSLQKFLKATHVSGLG